MPSYKSIDDANYDNAVTVDAVDEKVKGQSQTVREPDNGEVTVNEVRVTTDQVIVDPHHELAVQVLPEGSSVGVLPPVGQGFAEGKSALDVFGGDADDADETVPVKTAKDSKASSKVSEATAKS